LSDVATRPPLRLLFVASELEPTWRGGVGRVVAGSARALAERGHSVHIAGRAPSGVPGEIPGVQLHPWPALRWKLAQLPFLLSLARRLRPDVVHFHSAVPHGAVIVPFLWWRRAHQRPLVFVTPYTGARSDYRKRRARRALRCADGVATNSQWGAERVLAAGASPERIFVVPAGVDVAPPCDPARRRPLVVAMSRLVRSKGIDLLLEAFARVAERHPAWRLIIAGTGREAAVLKQRASQLACAQRIEFPGVVAGEAKRCLLAEASLAVVPSRHDNSPGSLLEFQAHGIPCLAFAVGGIPELAADGKAARLVPAEDVPALAQALEELLSRPGLRASLAEGALQVTTERAWSRIAERWEDLYRDRLSLGRTF